MAAVDFTTTTYLSDGADPTAFTVVVSSTDEDLVPLMSQVFQIQCHLGPTDVVARTFPTYQEAVTYFLATYPGIFTSGYDSFKGTTGSTIGNIYDNIFRQELNALALKADISSLGTAAFSNSYNDLIDTPTVPTLVSQLTNDSGFLTSAPVSSVNAKTGAVVIDTTDLSDFATATDSRITTKINALLNGADAAHDTFKELQDLMVADETTATALATTVGNKVDKSTTVNGHALSGNVTVAYSDLASKPQMYFGSTLHNDAVMYTNSGTVSSGTVVFQLTNDGTSTGTALFPNGPATSSINLFVSDAAASYQMAGAWSNSNKTLTVTCNKLSTANILTGILGQAAGNGAIVNVTVWGR